LKRALFETQNIAYYHKVIDNYLSSDVIINLVDFPIEIAEIFHKNEGYVTRDFIASGKPQIYSIYYGKKEDNDKLGLKFN
jgi:hypothetical protein